MRNANWLFGVGWCVSALAFVALSISLVWPHVPIDDALITFRYAENLAGGAGAVFNLGERVEGFTSLS